MDPTTLRHRPALSRGVVFDAPPEAPAPVAFPERSGLTNELGLIREPWRLAWRTPQLLRPPRGDQRVTVVIPGWLAPERSMTPIRRFLDRAGHDARPWGLGTIRNDVEQVRDQFIERLGMLAGDRPAFLVGWSLGGVIARETARHRPDLVEQIVTFGTPAVGGPTYTAGARRFGVDECRRVEQLQAELDAEQPIETPITAIFTRNDGVVDWRACIDRSSLDVRHVEVSSTHVGLGVDPDVWQITAETLA